MTRDEFMTEISKVTEDFVARTTGFTESAENLKETELVSPLNGEPIYEGLSFYQNLSGEFKISKSIAGRRLEVDEVSTLLKDKRVGPLDDFIAKTGRKFSAMLQLEEDLKVSFVFNNNEEQESEENDQMKDSPVVAACPMCSGDVKQTEISYICTDHKRFPKVPAASVSPVSCWIGTFLLMNSSSWLRKKRPAYLKASYLGVPNVHLTQTLSSKTTVE